MKPKHWIVIGLGVVCGLIAHSALGQPGTAIWFVLACIAAFLIETFTVDQHEKEKRQVRLQPKRKCLIP